MPKKGARDKRGRRAVRGGGAAARSGVRSVKELLARVAPGLNSVTERVARQDYWQDWLTAHLAPALRARVTGCTESDGILVIYAVSGAWSARLRFALQELEAPLRAARPDITAVKVRVLPQV